MAIKNYSTKVPASKTVGDIQALLAKHGAYRVSVDYGEGGSALGLSFALKDASGTYAFRLPARTGAVQKLLEEQGVKCTDEHAENVAWRNLKDWVDAQIALIETGQVEAVEVMMPYLLDDSGRTLYESFSGRMLSGGDVS